VLTNAHVGNATANTHALNRITADGRYSLSSHNHDERYGQLNATNIWTLSNTVERTNPALATFASRITGDANLRSYFSADGSIYWRNGSDSTTRARIWRDGDDLNLQGNSKVNINSQTRVNDGLFVCRNGSSYQTYMGYGATNSAEDNMFNYYYGTTRQGYLRACDGGIFRIHGDSCLFLSSATDNSTSRGLHTDSNLKFIRTDTGIMANTASGSDTFRLNMCSFGEGSFGSARGSYISLFGVNSSDSRKGRILFVAGDNTGVDPAFEFYKGCVSIGFGGVSGYVPDQSCSVQAASSVQALGAMYMLKGTAVIGDVIFNVPASTESCYEITFWGNLNTPKMVKAILIVGANGGSNYSINYPTRSDNTYGIVYTTSTRAVRLSAPTATYHYTVMRTY
jgi:hypothetical protein